MSDNRWIIVRNWERFQHSDVLRGDTAPAWIKTYTRLLHNPDFDGLSWRDRGILMTIWLEFAASAGQLRVTSLPQSGQRRVRAESLQALQDAGFISLVASRPPKQAASPEKRREEKKPPYPPSGENPNGRNRKPSPEEIPSMVDVVTACQHFIAGQAWDDSYDEPAMREEFGRIERGRRTHGTINPAELVGLLEQWQATRQDRYGIKADLGGER